MFSCKIRNLTTLVIASIFTIAANSQNAVTDSLRNLLEKNPADTIKVYLLYKISDEYFYSTINDTAMIYARQAYKLAEEIGYEKGQARSLIRISNVLEGTGDFPEALKALHSSLELSEKVSDLVTVGAANNNIARVYTEQKTINDFNKAIVYYRKAKTIFEQLGDSKKLSTALMNIGDNFEKMDQLDSAWVYQKQAYDMSVKSGDINQIGITLVNLGYIHFKKGQIDSAFSNLRRGIDYLLESDDKESLPDAWNSLSDCFEKIKVIDSSIFYAKRSFELAEVADNKQAQLDAANQLTNLYGSLKAFDSGFKYSRLATEIKSDIYDHERAGEIQRMYDREQIRQQTLEAQRLADAKKRADNLQIISISVFIITFFVVLILLSQKKINPRAIEILGVLGLLLVFEFITIFVHPFIGDLTHHSPVYMLIILVLIASVLGPLHHFLTKWLKKKLVRRTVPENKVDEPALILEETRTTVAENKSSSQKLHSEHHHVDKVTTASLKMEPSKQPAAPSKDEHHVEMPAPVIKNTDPNSGEKKK